ncbi:MAG: hypothetical protein ACRBBK_14550 [Paracoccaceae bacterium]
MLWDTLTFTLETLLHWEVYAAGFIYFIFLFGPLLLLSLLNEGAVMVGAFLVQPFFQALGILTFVTLVTPIALGFTEDAAWHLPWQFVSEQPLEVSKAALILIGVSLAAAFVPILGQLPSFAMLVVGIIATKLVFDLAGVEGLSVSDFLPSLSVGIGILFLGAVVSLVGMLAGMLLSLIIAPIFRMNSEDAVSLLSFPVASTIGFVPLLVYLSWLRIIIP